MDIDESRFIGYYLITTAELRNDCQFVCCKFELENRQISSIIINTSVFNFKQYTLPTQCIVRIMRLDLHKNFADVWYCSEYPTNKKKMFEEEKKGIKVIQV
jgi:hypothetical protein